MAVDQPIRVNRAPVLTLWAAVVAERMGHPPDTALSLASAVAGTAARAKGRRLGLVEDRAPEDLRDVASPRPVVRLLGKDIPMASDADGVVLAAGSDGKPAPAAPVRAYLAKAFGDRLAEARAAMELLAATLPPEELNRIGFRLYERFRPEVPRDATGWGAKGEFDLQKVAEARGLRGLHVTGGNPAALALVGAYWGDCWGSSANEPLTP